MLQNLLSNNCQLDNYHVILANGKFPTHLALHNLLQNALSIICCDGAVNKLVRHNLEPNYIIGDCDSLSTKLRQIYANKLVIDSDQDSNDLTKALNFIHKNINDDTVIVMGASGLREDHTLGNIAILAQHYNKFKQLLMISDYGIFNASNGECIIKTVIGQQISFFSLSHDNILNCEDLKWPLINHKLSTLNSGTLNEATKNTLKLNSTDVTIVYRAFEIKKHGGNV